MALCKKSAKRAKRFHFHFSGNTIGFCLQNNIFIDLKECMTSYPATPRLGSKIKAALFSPNFFLMIFKLS